MQSRPARRAVVVLLAAVLAVGCDRTPPPETGMSSRQFIDVVVALRRAAQEHGDPEGYDAARQQVLRDAAVTDSMLLEFVRVRGHDVHAMAAVWDSISRRLARPDIEEGAL
jgi:hypothetical protein